MAFDNPSYYLTAYGIAVKHGYRGTEEEWLTSLSAYGMAVAMGYEGTKEEWLQKLNDPVPVITIGEVVTLPGGSDATVTLGGTKYNPVLNFGIPRGIGMVDALPLTGGTMQGDINMGGYKILGLSLPTGNDEAVNKEYADKIKNTADGALQRKGGTIEGNILMAGFRMIGIPAPVANDEPASKEYTDESVKSAKEIANSKCRAVAITVTLYTAGWSSNEQAVDAENVTADEEKCHVIASPVEASREAYNDAVVRCIAQGDGMLTFGCDDVPEYNLTVGVLVLITEDTV